MQKSFNKRGFHIDQRIQVMTMPALRKLAEEMAEMNLNTLLMEWEGSYPFQRHATISNKYAYTRKEMEDFIAYTGKLGIDVIPLQECFGHIEYILRHERYAHLREDKRDLCQLCPCKIDEALETFGEIFADVAAMHPSEYLQIGGDETYLLGKCPVCQAKAAAEGKSKLYVDYVKEIAALVMRLGKRPVMWADMLLKHPEAAGELPKESVFIDWNYGWAFDRFGDLSSLRKYGFEFWAATSLRSEPDNHSLITWKKHFNNLEVYLPFARNWGFTGMIQTSWSTSGAYGYQWDRSEEVAEIYPVRRVYPLAGFRVLQRAFVAAVDSPETISTRDFVLQYARERFGFKQEQGEKLWEALTKDETLIRPEVEVAPVLKLAQEACDLMNELTPADNEAEFEHLRLMLDLREHHLRFKLVEQEIQSADFTDSEIPRHFAELEKLMKETPALNRRFELAIDGFLYPAEIREEIDFRTAKLRGLRDRLGRRGRPEPGTPGRAPRIDTSDPRLILSGPGKA